MGVKTVYECDFCGLVDEVGKNQDSKLITFIKLVSNDKDVPLWFQAFGCKECKIKVLNDLDEFLKLTKYER